MKSTFNNFKLLVWRNRFAKLKACKVDLSKELMPVAWHPTRWRNWYLPDDEKKISRNNFY